MKSFFNKKIRIFVTFLFLGLSLVFLNKINFLSGFQEVAIKINEPIVYFLKKVSFFFEDLTLAFLRPLEIKNENKRLREENLELQSKLAYLQEIEKENQILKEQLSILKESKYKFLGAEVIAQNPEPFSDTIIINRGKKDGLDVGMGVVFGGFLVGEISEVFDDYSKVLLINSPLSKIGAITQESRVEGLVKGEIGGGIVMEKIFQDEDLKIGEFVLTSGLGGKMKKGIPIGRIDNIFNLEGGLFRKAEIFSPINFKKLEFVFVILY